MKKRKNKSVSYAESERRRLEIDKYGKLVSLRPSIEHRDKKKYTRKSKHKRKYD